MLSKCYTEKSIQPNLNVWKSQIKKATKEKDILLLAKKINEFENYQKSRNSQKIKYHVELSQFNKNYPSDEKGLNL